jgi:hypothetical protein
VFYSCSIPLEAVYTEGSIPPTIYNVVKDEEYHGEIKVGVTFTPEVFFIYIQLSDKANARMLLSIYLYFQKRPYVC